MTPAPSPAVRLLVLDIDGTLIGADGVLRPRTIAAVGAALAAGVRVALATGRMPSSALPIARRLGIGEPIIGLQGAAIREIPPDGAAKRGRLLFHRPLPAATTRDAVTWCREAGLMPHLSRLETMYFDESDRHLDAWSRWLPTTVHVVSDVGTWAGPPVSKVIAIGPPGRPAAVLDDASARFDGRARVMVSHPEFLEFVAPGVSKGRAVRWLARRAGIPLTAAMAIGDQLNDLEMITAVGFGVAMPDGPAELLAAARLVAPPLAEDGVAAVVEQVVLGGSPPTASGPGIAPGRAGPGGREWAGAPGRAGGRRNTEEDG
jgi:5-amino-6-(5-phospho-D-ribitylamino)uracil phosphatase